MTSTLKSFGIFLQNSDLFSDYLNSSDDSFNSDKDFVVAFFREIVAPNVKISRVF